MRNQFTSYELAVELKELGFDEPCLAFYDADKKFNYSTTSTIIYLVKIKTPLWQQAFDFFRKKYSLEGYAGLCHFDDMTYGYNITTYTGKSHYLAQGRDYKSYEEARKACLKNLIRLCQK